MGAQMSGFFERWSRNKRVADAASKQLDAADAPTDIPAESEAIESEDELLGEEILKALPSVDDITVDTDIMAFLQRGVPRAVKNAALRKMWLLDPIIRSHQDVAVDYAWDWNTPGGVPGSGGAVDPENAAELIRKLFGNKPAEQSDANAAASPKRLYATRRKEDALSAEIANLDKPTETLSEQEDEIADCQPQVASHPKSPVPQTSLLQTGPRCGTPITRRRHGRALPE